MAYMFYSFGSHLWQIQDDPSVYGEMIATVGRSCGCLPVDGLYSLMPFTGTQLPFLNLRGSAQGGLLRLCQGRHQQ